MNQHRHKWYRTTDTEHVNRILSAVTVLCLVTSYSYAGVKEKKPNLIVILADDLGYGDLSSYGAEDISTPNIDRMATEGMTDGRFKLIRFPEANLDTWEFFDLRNDPMEMKSCYGDKKYGEAISRLKNELARLRRQYKVED